MRGTNVLPNEVGRFLERIGLYLTAAWIMTSSEWFLNLRLLAAPDEYSDRYKYSKLTTSIFDQLSKGGDPYERGARLTSFEGKSAESLIRENENLHISAQLQDFVSNINWLTLRSVFYVGYANYYGYSLCLHPIRHCFLSSYFESGVSGSSDPSVSSLVNFFTNKSSDALKNFDEDTMCPNVGLQLPWIIAWLLGKHRSPKKALSAAYELRDHPRLQKVRRRFSEIFEIQGNTISLKSKKDMISLRNDVVREIEEIFISNSRISKAVAFSVKLTESQLTTAMATMEGLINKHKNGAVRGFFRNIVEDINSYQTLGELRGLARADITIDSNLGSNILAVDAPHFRLANSHWKRPF